MQIGRFFSFGQGCVGQYLSPRVLVVRLPFRPVSPDRESREFCCFGFDSLKQAQRFIQSLSHLRLKFQLRRSQILQSFSYEVLLNGQTDLARTLAFWDRRDRYPISADSLLRRASFKAVSSEGFSTPAIAA